MLPQNNSTQPPPDLTPQIIMPTVTLPSTEIAVAPNQPYQPAEVGFNQAEAFKLESKKRLKKRLILGAILSVALVLVPVIVYISLSTAFKLKTITYDNGEGSQFGLKFYSNYKSDKVYSLVSAQKQSEGANPNLVALYSKVQLHGKAPIKLFISTSDLTQSNLSRYAKNKGCDTIPVAFTVHNDYANDDLNVCSISSKGIELLYVVAFKDSSKFYVATILQDIDFSKAGSSPQAAQKTLALAGLQSYQDDIKEIVASIKVTN